MSKVYKSLEKREEELRGTSQKNVNQLYLFIGTLLRGKRCEGLEWGQWKMLCKRRGVCMCIRVYFFLPTFSVLLVMISFSLTVVQGQALVAEGEGE